MNCSEFKGAIKDYLEGRLSESRRAEFREHLLSCDYCKRDMGSEVAALLSGDKGGGFQRESRQRYPLYFALFILFVLLMVICLEYFKIREYSGGEMSPISVGKSSHLTGGHLKKVENTERAEGNAVSNEEQGNSDVASVANPEPEDSAGEGEDFSSYSRSELKNRLSECMKEKEYKCISSAAIFLAKKSSGSERREYRLLAIEALVEQMDCSAAMLNIMVLFKESPDREQVNRAHLLNARCYIKEKNFRDAEKIISMVEKDAPEMKEEIAKLRKEIKEGEGDGE